MKTNEATRIVELAREQREISEMMEEGSYKALIYCPKCAKWDITFGSGHFDEAFTLAYHECECGSNDFFIAKAGQGKSQRKISTIWNNIPENQKIDQTKYEVASLGGVQGYYPY